MHLMIGVALNTIDKAGMVVKIHLLFWLPKEPFTWRIATGASLITAGLLVMVWK